MKVTESRNGRILVVDDERDVRDLLCFLLKGEGFDPWPVADGDQALCLISQKAADVVLLDLNMPGRDGLCILKEARKIDLTLPILLLTGHGSINSAVEAVRLGAQDYLTKPFDNRELVTKLRQAVAQRRGPVLPRQASGDFECNLEERMGPGPQIARLIADLHRVAPTDFTVVVTGETGSGKELVARALHRKSRRSGGPFIPVDCGAIQPTLIESELFGHEKGAFTGADRVQTGKMESAAGGTLFLDEIQNLPVSVQTRFLRALQERQISRVGGTRLLDLDIRVVVASNVDLAAQVAAGRFRQDLYHRLNEFSVRVPALRQRLDDLLYLTSRFIAQTCGELDKPLLPLSPAALEALRLYRWPGNVRELRNVIRRAVLLADEQIEPHHLGEVAGSASQLQGSEDEFPEGGGEKGEDEAVVPLKERVRQSVMQAEKEILLEVLRQTNGNQAKAARLLQIDYKTMRTKARQYGIPLPRDGRSQPVLE